MNTLGEYLKIKKMSSGQEIGEYIGVSVDISSLKNCLTSFLNYYLIVRTVINEENQTLWDDYERAKTKYQTQNQTRKQENRLQFPANKAVLNENGSNEARVIQLFPKDPN